MVLRKSLSLALALFGLFVSSYLLYTYTSTSIPMVCIGIGCDAVRASAYSTMLGIPMPVFGVLGYSLLAIIIVAESLFSAQMARWARYILLGLTGFGFLFSLYLEYLQAFVIHAYCAWCVTSGIVMTGLFVLAVLNVDRIEPDPDPAMQLTWIRSLLLVCTIGLLVGSPAFYLLVRHSKLSMQTSNTTLANLAQRLTHPDSHAIGNPESPLTVVEFGDFECSACGRGEAVARHIRNQYANQIRFVFRHFPLERIHPFAQKAAEASECAGEQGKFWEMVEKIYSRQSDLSIKGLQRDAAELGLNLSQFNQCLVSGATAERVHRDIEDGRALGVRGTPTFFIGQQRVEGVLPTAEFAQLVAEHLASLGGPVALNEPARKSAPAGPDKQQKQSLRHNAPEPGTAKFSVTNSPEQNINSTHISPGLLGTVSQGPLSSAQPLVPSGPFGVLQASSGGTCSEADVTKPQPALIHTAELRRLLQSGIQPLFVDVRPAAEYGAGCIPGAINLPADEIERRWNILPKDRVIIIYESGRSPGDICARSRAAGRALLEHGFPSSQVKVYEDGFAGWKKAGIDIRR